MNSRAYYSVDYDGYRHYGDADEDSDEAKWLNDYEILQYNNLFDKKEESTVFFPYYSKGQ